MLLVMNRGAAAVSRDHLRLIIQVEKTVLQAVDERVDIAAGKIRAAHAHGEERVSGKEQLFFLNVEGAGTRRVARSVHCPGWDIADLERSPIFKENVKLATVAFKFATNVEELTKHLLHPGDIGAYGFFTTQMLFVGFSTL